MKMMGKKFPDVKTCLVEFFRNFPNENSNDINSVRWLKFTRCQAANEEITNYHL